MPTPAPTDARFSLKDYFTIGISLTALLITLVSSYVNFQVVDDMRMIMSHSPFVTLAAGNKELNISRTNNFAFINAGTRSAVINEIGFVFNQPTKASELAKSGCNSAESFGLSYSGIPLVVKAAEIISKDVSVVIGGGALKADAQNVRVPLSDANLNRKTIQYRMCLMADLSTPGADYIGVSLKQFDGELERSDYGSGDVAFVPGQIVEEHPIQILKKTHLFFWTF